MLPMNALLNQLHTDNACQIICFSTMLYIWMYSVDNMFNLKRTVMSYALSYMHSSLWDHPVIFFFFFLMTLHCVHE